jgi:hypothetical protein
LIFDFKAFARNSTAGAVAFSKGILRENLPANIVMH